MKLAMPISEGRISPVFDVASRLLVLEIEGDSERSREEIPLMKGSPFYRVRTVSESGIDVLICGAISWSLEMTLASAGVQVFSFTCGETEDVLRGYLCGQIDQIRFSMPGCRRRRGEFSQCRFRQGSCAGYNRKEVSMPRGNGKGPPMRKGQGQGQGQGGRRGRGQGGMQGGQRSGTGGSLSFNCVCPSCGYQIPHVQGQPCTQMTCPQCGAGMTRG